MGEIVSSQVLGTLAFVIPTKQVLSDPDIFRAWPIIADSTAAVAETEMKQAQLIRCELSLAYSNETASGGETGIRTLEAV
jgi:hypothetical protein